MTDNNIFVLIVIAVILLLVCGGVAMCSDRVSDRVSDQFSDASRNIPFEEPVFYEPGALMRGEPVFQGPFGVYDIGSGGRPYRNYGNPINTNLINSLSGGRSEGFIHGRPRYDPSWGGRFRRGPVTFMGPGFIPGDQYGPLPPGRRPFGGRCNCHYETGHIKYSGGKCYQPWAPKVDPRDSCYDLRNF